MINGEPAKTNLLKLLETKSNLYILQSTELIFLLSNAILRLPSTSKIVLFLIKAFSEWLCRGENIVL